MNPYPNHPKFQEWHDTVIPDPHARMYMRQQSCDRCPARAVYCVAFPSRGELVFCGHHGRRYETALLENGAVIFDLLEDIPV